MSKIMKSEFYYTSPKRKNQIKPLNQLLKYKFTKQLPKIARIMMVMVLMIFLRSSYDFPLIYYFVLSIIQEFQFPTLHRPPACWSKFFSMLQQVHGRSPKRNCQSSEAMGALKGALQGFYRGSIGENNLGEFWICS